MAQVIAPLERTLAGRRVSALVIVAALVGVAMLIRLVWLTLIAPSEITPDGAEYARAANNLRHGLGYVGLRGGTLFVFPPLYSFAIAAAATLTGHSQTAAVAVSVIAGCALVALVFWCAEQLYDRPAAVFAAAIVAAMPFALDLSDIALSDALFLALATAGVLCTLRIVAKPTLRDGALAGAAFGCAYLTRPEGLVLALGAIVAIAAALVLRVPRPRTAAGGAAALAIVFTVLAAPYVGFLSARAHQFRLEGKSAVNLRIAERMHAGMSYTQAADAVDDAGAALGPELDPTYEYARPGAVSDPLGNRIAVLVASAARHLVDIPRTLISRPYGTVLLFVAALWGLASGPWSYARLRGEVVVLLYAAGLFASLASVFHFWPRYADGFILPLALWSGRGIEQLRVLINRRFEGSGRRLNMSAVAAALIVLLFATALTTRTIMRDNVNDSGSVTERIAGQWLAAHDPPRSRIFSASDQSVFYAHGTWIQAPWAPRAAAALRYVERTRPDYLILDREQSEERPYLREWIDHGIPDGRAQLVHVFGAGRAPEVAVYRWAEPRGT